MYFFKLTALHSPTHSVKVKVSVVLLLTDIVTISPKSFNLFGEIMLNNYHNGAFNKGNPAPTRNQHTVPSKLRRIFRSFGQKIVSIKANRSSQ